MDYLTRQHKIPTVTNPDKLQKNFAGKGKNAGNQHFLLFPQFFLPYQNKSLFVVHFRYTCIKFNPFPNTPFSDPPKFKEAADDN